MFWLLIIAIFGLYLNPLKVVIQDSIWAYLTAPYFYILVLVYLLVFSLMYLLQKLQIPYSCIL